MSAAKPQDTQDTPYRPHAHDHPLAMGAHRSDPLFQPSYPTVRCAINPIPCDYFQGE